MLGDFASLDVQNTYRGSDAYVVAIMSLTTGGIIDYAVGAYKGKGTGEHALLRQIKDSIHKDDIVMGDRYFPCFS